MAVFALLSQIVIDSTNKWLDLWTVGDGDVEVSITEQTYDTIFDVLSAFQTAIQAEGGDFAAATIALDYSVANGRVKLTGTTTTSVKFKTGTHGSDNADTHAGDVLGWSDSADESGASSYISDYQHKYGWYVSHGPKHDSYDKPVVKGPAPVKVAAGYVRRVTNPNALKNRKIGWEAIYQDKWNPDDAATNESFSDWWEWAARLYSFGYYTDVENETLSGTYGMVSPVDELAASEVRESAGSAYYSIDMVWDKDPI